MRASQQGKVVRRGSWHSYLPQRSSFRRKRGFWKNSQLREHHWLTRYFYCAIIVHVQLHTFDACRSIGLYKFNGGLERLPWSVFIELEFLSQKYVTMFCVWLKCCFAENKYIIMYVHVHFVCSQFIIALQVFDLFHVKCTIGKFMSLANFWSELHHHSNRPTPMRFLCTALLIHVPMYLPLLRWRRCAVRWKKKRLLYSNLAQMHSS